jgi:hypothetical protein
LPRLGIQILAEPDEIGHLSDALRAPARGGVLRFEPEFDVFGSDSNAAGDRLSDRALVGREGAG